MLEYVSDRDCSRTPEQQNTRSLVNLSSRELSQIQKLIERKEVLAEQIAEIDSQLEAIESGGRQSATPAGNGASAKLPAQDGRKRRGRGRGHGYLEAKITSELQAAGKEGVKVKDLAAKLGTGYGNITTFFQTTGKAIKQIKKVAPARFAWVG